MVEMRKYRILLYPSSLKERVALFRHLENIGEDTLDISGNILGPRNNARYLIYMKDLGWCGALSQSNTEGAIMISDFIAKFKKRPQLDLGNIYRF